MDTVDCGVVEVDDAGDGNAETKEAYVHNMQVMW